MSKDVGTLIEMGILNRVQALEWHISSNFFPPHPKYVKDSMVDGFKKYWAGEINEEQLKDKCYLRDLSGLYRYFGEFMDMKEEEEK